jgi:hypothetical protein
MPVKTKFTSYLCSSADWECCIDNASCPEEAASMALQKQINNDEERFSVGTSVLVVPIKKFDKESKLIFSPSVLADIGMHKYASELIKHIDKND